MKNLEHQERLLQFITEFDNIYGCHLYKTFLDNLKKIYNQIKSKRQELLEDFSEKMEKIENMNYLKKLKNKFLLWKQIAEEEKQLDKGREFYEKKMKEKIMNHLKKSHMFTKNLLKLVKNNINDDKKLLLDKLYNHKIKTDNNYTKAISKLNKLFNNNDDKLKKDNFDKMKMFDFIDHLKDIKDALDDKHKKDFLKKLKKLNDYYNMKDYFKKWKNTIDKKNIFKKLIRIRKKELDRKKNFTIDSNVNNLNVIDDKNPNEDKCSISPIKPKSNEITISNENSINFIKKESPQKVLSIGNAGLDFSIIAPELYYINEVETSKKMPKIENLNDFFEKSQKFLSFLNNEKTKKYFDNWKDKLYSKKILNKLMTYQIKDIKLKQIQNKLLKLIKNKLKQKKFDGIDNDDDLLNKAFYLWKKMDTYYSKTQNFKKIKVKLKRPQKDETAQTNLEPIDYVIDPLVNSFEVIADKTNKDSTNLMNSLSNEKNNESNNNNYTDSGNKKFKNNKLKYQKIQSDYLYSVDDFNENEDIKKYLDMKICQNEPFTLLKTENDSSIIDNEKKTEGNADVNNKIVNLKKRKKGKRRPSKKLVIQKDNDFSIINKKYINNKDNKNNNDGNGNSNNNNDGKENNNKKNDGNNVNSQSSGGFKINNPPSQPKTSEKKGCC